MQEIGKIIILVLLFAMVVASFTSLIKLKRQAKKEAQEYKKREEARRKSLEEIENGK